MRLFKRNHWHNTDLYIAKKALPQIKKLNKNKTTYPNTLTFNEWTEILDKIIWSLERIIEDKILTKEDDKKEQEGCKLFGKYFTELWD